jgi:hypothetical protein
MVAGAWRGAARRGDACASRCLHGLAAALCVAAVLRVVRDARAAPEPRSSIAARSQTRRPQCSSLTAPTAKGWA